MIWGWWAPLEDEKPAPTVGRPKRDRRKQAAARRHNKRSR